MGSAVSLLSALFVIGAAWWLVAPPALAGSTSFATIDGTSMLPNLHRDDLVALRESSSYRVGDVVAYRSALLQRIVLHRIVAIDNGLYTFKGDNNAFLDPEHPTEAQLVGKLFVRIPVAGRVVPIMHVPWIVGVLAALLVLTMGLGGGSGRPVGAEHSDPS
jgi:signal peptidase I